LVARDDTLIAKPSIARVISNGESNGPASQAKTAHIAATVVLATRLECMTCSRA